MAQRKIPVVLSFPYHRHKAGGASPLVMCTLKVGHKTMEYAHKTWI